MPRWMLYLSIVSLLSLGVACQPASDTRPIGVTTVATATVPPPAPVPPTPQATVAVSTLAPTAVPSTLQPRLEPMVAPIRPPLLATLPPAPTVARNTVAPTPARLFAPAPGSPMTITGWANGALGDVNGDGRADMVVTNDTERQLTVLLGQSDGQLRAAPGSPISVPERPIEVVMGDVNGDNALDLAFTSHYTYDITLLLGDGAGGFKLAPNSPVTIIQAPREVARIKIGLDIGDLNADRLLDMVTVNSQDNHITVAFGDGHGMFRRAPTPPYAAGKGVYPRSMGDLNGDGYLDIVATVSGASSQALSLLLGDGRGGFRRSEVPVRTVQPWLVAIGDMNGDGKPDLVATHAERAELSVLLGDGRGAFAEVSGSPVKLGLSQKAYDPVIADVNGDGKTDVAVAAGDEVVVLLGDGQGGLTTAPGSPFPTATGPWKTFVGDVNGDGKPDLATSHLKVGSISLLLGQ